MSNILLPFFRKRKLDREFDDELAAHIELAMADHFRRGMPLPEARRRALAELGGIEPARELHRESRGLPWLDGIVQDIRYAVRGLRRSPGFTLTAIATLALGIGVNAGVFMVTNAILFKGPPFIHRNDRIVYMSTQENGRGCCASWPDFQDWRAQAKSFEGMAAVNGVWVSLDDRNGLLQRTGGMQVSSDFFRLLGQRPFMGRDFVPSDETPGATPVAILTYSLWERRYGKDPAIVGRTVRINGTPTTMIGVMARGFSFPWMQDLWVPLTPTPDIRQRERRNAVWFAIGRMADGITIESARAEMETIGKRLSSAYPVLARLSHSV